MFFRLLESLGVQYKAANTRLISLAGYASPVLALQWYHPKRGSVDPSDGCGLPREGTAKSTPALGVLGSASPALPF
ncbi:MAG: hypothetical protein LBH75_06510 [Treponema sp.]|nr:hypothetical protein [Treponema sp.]